MGDVPYLLLFILLRFMTFGKGDIFHLAIDQCTGESIRNTFFFLVTTWTSFSIQDLASHPPVFQERLLYLFFHFRLFKYDEVRNQLGESMINNAIVIVFPGLVYCSTQWKQLKYVNVTMFVLCYCTCVAGVTLPSGGVNEQWQGCTLWSCVS